MYSQVFLFLILSMIAFLPAIIPSSPIPSAIACHSFSFSLLTNMRRCIFHHKLCSRDCVGESQWQDKQRSSIINIKVIIRLFIFLHTWGFAVTLFHFVFFFWSCSRCVCPYKVLVSISLASDSLFSSRFMHRPGMTFVGSNWNQQLRLRTRKDERI